MDLVVHLQPIMFSAGIGQVDDALTDKMKPSKGMKIVKIGGPAYRIGMGGGSASSQPVITISFIYEELLLTFSHHKNHRSRLNQPVITRATFFFFLLVKKKPNF